MKKSEIVISNPFYNPKALQNFMYEMMEKKSLLSSHTDVYTRAGISRQNFSNYYSGKNCPTPENARRLAVGLKCTVAEADKLLAICGYSFVEEAPYDEAVKYCLSREIFNYIDVELYISRSVGFFRKEAVAA